MPLVCKVFEDKTIAGFEAVKDKLNFQVGTVKHFMLILTSGMVLAKDAVSSPNSLQMHFLLLPNST